MVPSLSGMEDTGAAGWDTEGAGQQAYTTHGTVGHWNARQHDGNTSGAVVVAVTTKEQVKWSAAVVRKQV
ncbi:unnamed protein product [Sphagnum jensenii]